MSDDAVEPPGFHEYVNGAVPVAAAVAVPVPGSEQPEFVPVAVTVIAGTVIE